ncbi:MAG: ABC transporter ATP-binding protein [Planctomycetota bacterium]|nr:ABC transporter ATP-binding protein [Planctomycetota bacterium]
METPVVAAAGLGFAYGRTTALEGFNLDVASGRITLLLGLNGAGKSTALALLSGKLRPREGRIRIAGSDPRRASARRRLWLLEEVAAPPPHLTAREAVGFHLDLYGRTGSRKDAIVAALDRVGLTAVAKKRAGTFSKGMRRRLELGCLLAVDPEVWLLDEPQTGLDPRGLRLLKDLCLEARGRGRSLVIASHALADVPALADDVHILRGGRTAFSGTRDGLLAEVGARSFVVSGNKDTFDQALRELASAHGVTLDGPQVPHEQLEELLFREEDRTS